MRKTVVIVMGIIVAASCVPWLRHQHFFSVLVGATIIALAGFIVFGGVGALFAWLRSQQAGATQSGWWSPRVRNRLLGAAFFLVLMLTVPHFMATTSGAYKLAIATALQSPQFGDTLGDPVTEAWFSQGKEEWGSPARAEMLIPVRGRMRRGNLRALAIKNDGRWRLTELTLELSQPEEHIDLLRVHAQTDPGQ
jgi:Cytochrome oxidase complex assembly protein 1